VAVPKTDCAAEERLIPRGGSRGSVIHRLDADLSARSVDVARS
jgi:hypothetical protein